MRGSKFCPRKVFEEVQYHVFDLLRKFNSSQSYFFVKWAEISIANNLKAEQICNSTRDQKF